MGCVYVTQMELTYSKSIFYEKRAKMANVMLEILDGFSSVRVLMYRHSKSTIMQVTENFELE